ncbi:MAG: hypothetical protein MI922_28685, partial [Bacteroidales bacterium]|nr:hypothetical protein [Bacteroidales bacterium]
MFEDLKKNLEQEKRIVVQMKTIAAGIRDNPKTASFYSASLRALAEQLDLLNNSVPDLLGEWNLADASEKKGVFVKPEKEKVPEKKKVVKVAVASDTKGKKFVTLNKKDRVEFLKKLRLSEKALKGVRESGAKKVDEGVKRVNPYISFSSKYFRKFSDGLSPQFEDLGRDLKRANIPILLSSYLSMAIMSCLIAFCFGLFLFLLLLVVSLSNWFLFILPFGFVGLTMAGFYFYPASEASGVQKNINYELPFATIHMAAIAGSNITPVKSFKIIARSSEYKNIGAEMKKVVAQIEVYGYDIVTS